MTLYLYSKNKEDVIIENVKDVWISQIVKEHYRLYWTETSSCGLLNICSVAFDPVKDEFSVHEDQKEEEEE